MIQCISYDQILEDKKVLLFVNEDKEDVLNKQAYNETNKNRHTATILYYMEQRESCKSKKKCAQ